MLIDLIYITTTLKIVVTIGRSKSLSDKIVYTGFDRLTLSKTGDIRNFLKLLSKIIELYININNFKRQQQQRRQLQQDLQQDLQLGPQLDHLKR